MQEIRCGNCSKKLGEGAALLRRFGEYLSSNTLAAGVVCIGLAVQAINYLHNQWPKLVRYVVNGAWPICNIPCENAIRPFVVGRKGWMFADTVGGANASANLHSLVETCKATGIEPYRYLTWLLKALPLAQTVDDYTALLPWSISS